MNSEFRNLVASLVHDSMDREATSAAVAKAISFINSINVFDQGDGKIEVSFDAYDIEVSIEFDQDGEFNGMLVITPEAVSVDDKIVGRELFVELFR